MTCRPQTASSSGETRSSLESHSRTAITGDDSFSDCCSMASVREAVLHNAGASKAMLVDPSSLSTSHRPSASLDSDTSFSSVGSELLADVTFASQTGRLKPQRMQSYLAPKMTIHSPAPWTEDPEELNEKSDRPASPGNHQRCNSSPAPLVTGHKRPRTPFGKLSHQKQRKMSSSALDLSPDSSQSSSLDMAGEAADPKEPPIARRQTSLSSLSSHRNTLATSPATPPAFPSELQRLRHQHTKTAPSPSTTPSSSFLASDPASKSSSPSPARSDERLDFSKVTLARASQALASVPLNIPQERQPRPSTTLEYPRSPTSAELPPVPPERTVKNRRSGFLKLFRKDMPLETTAAPPLPSPGLPKPLPRSETRTDVKTDSHPAPPAKPRLQPISPISISIPPPHKDLSPVTIVTPPPKTGSSYSTGSGFPRGMAARARMASHPGQTLAPTLNLRPVSMAFSDAFAKDLLAPGQRTLAASASANMTPMSSPTRTLLPPSSPTHRHPLPSPTHRHPLPSPTQSIADSSLFDHDSGATRTPTTASLYLGSPRSPFVQSPSMGSRSDANASSKMWEMEQQIRRMESEMAAIKRERDDLLKIATCAKTCEYCGCGTSPGGTPLLHRARPLAGESPLFSSKG